MSYMAGNIRAVLVTGHDHHAPKQPWHISAIEFQGTQVTECTQLKLLGVTFDDRLNYASHIRSAASRSCQRLRFLRKASQVLDIIIRSAHSVS